ncbi:MAG: cyanophycinase [Myxococcales bacterium]|nr:cyanophycinase [Myxococcales bacterium]
MAHVVSKGSILLTLVAALGCAAEPELDAGAAALAGPADELEEAPTPARRVPLLTRSPASPRPSAGVATARRRTQSPVDRPAEGEDDARVRLPLAGTIVAHGGGPLTGATMERFAELCGRGSLVLIPTANEEARRPRYRRRIARRWSRFGFADVAVLHARRRADANRRVAVRTLRDADCVWFGGGVQQHLIDRYVGTRVDDELHALLQRGGTIGGYSAGTAIMTDVMIRHGNPTPYEGHGFGILPDIIVDQHFVAEQREPRLLAMLERHPTLVGYGVDEGTALVVTGERFRVIGESVVRRCTHDGGCEDLRPGDTGQFPGRL